MMLPNINIPSDSMASSVIAEFTAALQRQAELTAQELLQSQHELELKEKELEELHRKNNIEEERAAKLLYVSTKVEQLHALIAQYLDSYVQQHHEPITGSLAVIRSRIEAILQSLLYVIPALLQNKTDEKLSRLQEQLFYLMNNPQAIDMPPNNSTTVVIDNSSKPSNFRTTTGDIRDFTTNERK